MRATVRDGGPDGGMELIPVSDVRGALEVALFATG